MRHVYVKRNINDKRLSDDSLWQCSNSTVYLQLSYKNTKKIVVFTCDRPGDKARAKEKKRKEENIITSFFMQSPKNLFVLPHPSHPAQQNRPSDQTPGIKNCDTD